jgi:predicted nucleotidyltransferase
MEVVLQQIIDHITYLTEPSEIVLFGSYASGRQRSNSDIDLLIVTDKLHNRHLLTKEVADFISQIGYRSDVIFMSKSEVESTLHNEKHFLYNALKNAKKIYKKGS